MPTPLTHCPECGVPFGGRNPRDPRKHYRTHYPPIDQIAATSANYLPRKRAAMLLANDADAEPPEGRPNVRTVAAPQPDEEEEVD